MAASLRPAAGREGKVDGVTESGVAVYVGKRNTDTKQLDKW